MHYYILPDSFGYKILKVQDADKDLFEQRHAKDIICDASSLGELLLQFAARLEDDPSSS